MARITGQTAPEAGDPVTVETTTDRIVLIRT